MSNGKCVFCGEEIEDEFFVTYNEKFEEPFQKAAKLTDTKEADVAHLECHCLLQGG